MILTLALGTNLGDKSENLINCINLLNDNFGNFLEISPVYLTEPYGDVLQDDFYNLCIVYNVDENLTPLQILGIIQKIENELGRTRTIHWGPRVIDVDILFLGNLNISLPNLIIPHPHINMRSFVVEPLSRLDIFKELSTFYTFTSVFQTKSVEIKKLF